MTLSDILAEMKSKVSNKALKVTVDDDLLLIEALAIYKNPGFDASRPLRLYFLISLLLTQEAQDENFLRNYFMKFQLQMGLLFLFY
jgi:hypothetical protein